jgi:hypothetical protein
MEKRSSGFSYRSSNLIITEIASVSKRKADQTVWNIKY